MAAGTPRHILENLQKLLAARGDVMAKSCGLEGEVRNGKMLLAASEQLRKLLKTLIKLREANAGSLEVGRFHSTIMEEIEKIDSAVPRRIAQRLLELNITWTVAGRCRMKHQKNGRGGSLDGYRHALLTTPRGPCLSSGSTRGMGKICVS